MQKFFRFTIFVVGVFFLFKIPNVSAKTSTIIIDAITGETILEKSADKKRYPASLTKMMTLYIAFGLLENGKLHLDDEIIVSQEAASRSPSKLGLNPGEKISVEDAIGAMIVRSANDCATALAEKISGTEQEFAKLMNVTAKNLGMKNSVFKNASGLGNRKHKSTARDMAILASAIYHHFPQYYKLFSATSFKFRGETFYTHNHLLKSFEGADGLKTGYIGASGYNIATSAHRNGQRVIAVTLGHDSIKLRDKFVAKQMDLALNRLEKTKMPKINTSDDQNQENNYGVALGEFSSYTSAKKYTVSLNPQFLQKNIQILPVSKEYALLYNAKVFGLSKNDAEKICIYLKKKNKPCILLENDSDNMKMALK